MTLKEWTKALLDAKSAWDAGDRSALARLDALATQVGVAERESVGAWERAQTLGLEAGLLQLARDDRAAEAPYLAQSEICREQLQQFGRAFVSSLANAALCRFRIDPLSDTGAALGQEALRQLGATPDTSVTLEELIRALRSRSEKLANTQTKK